MNGHGVFKGADGYEYTGQYANGAKSGQGVETMPDKSKYDGWFEDDQ